MALGLIAMEARESRDLYRMTAADKIGINYKTLSDFEGGRRAGIPATGSRTAIEVFYGWRLGAIRDIWDRRHEIPFGSLTEGDLKPIPGPEKTGLLEAKHLTDQQLINELSFRLLMRGHGED